MSRQEIKVVDKYDVRSLSAVTEFFPEHFPDEHYPDEAEFFKRKYGNIGNVIEMYSQDKLWVVARNKATKELGGIMLIGERAPEQIHIFWVIVAQNQRRKNIASSLVQVALNDPRAFLTKSGNSAKQAIFTASIKEGNIASEGLFRKVRFTSTSAHEYQDNPDTYAHLEFNNDGSMDLWTRAVQS